MTPGLTDDAVDEIIASCDGDLRGAVKALMLVNEQLERELEHVYATVAHGNPLQPGKTLLH